jgi:hypothetical protein
MRFKLSKFFQRKLPEDPLADLREEIRRCRSRALGAKTPEKYLSELALMRELEIKLRKEKNGT